MLSLGIIPGPKNQIPENQLEEGAGAEGRGGASSGLAASLRLRDGRLLLAALCFGVERWAALFCTARLNSLAASEGESDEKSSTSLGLLGGVASFLANMLRVFVDRV